MHSSEDDLDLGEPRFLRDAWIADLAADVFEGEPRGAAPGEQIDRSGQRPVLQYAGGSNAGAVEPFVLEHRLEPRTQRCCHEDVPAPVIVDSERRRSWPMYSPRRMILGRLEVARRHHSGCCRRSSWRRYSQRQIGQRPVGHPGDTQDRGVGVGAVTFWPVAVEDTGREAWRVRPRRSPP